MRQPTGVEVRAPVTVTVLPQVEIVASAVQPDCQQAHAPPVVEPPVDERQLGRLSLDEHGRERSLETTSGVSHGTSQ
jgi:hypothetical protein